MMNSRAGSSTECSCQWAESRTLTDSVSITGLTETEAKQLNREVHVSRFPWAASGRAQSIGRTEGLTKVLIDPDTERILGIGIVGPGAGEMVAEGVLAVEMGANAIINVRFATSSVAPGAAELFAYGTAVKVQ